jgi:hypothetical protein
MGLAATEGGLEPDDRIAALASDALEQGRQDASKTFR